MMAARFAFVLAREFTLSPFSLFLDTLRLAGDEGDRSRRVQFDWQIVGNCGLPVRSSCGVELMPTRPVGDPLEYDMIVVVGGLLNVHRGLSEKQEAFVRRAASNDVPLVGLCTGTFILAEYGLLDGYDVSVSWFHIHQFRALFPSVRAHADCVFALDRNRATCAGGAGAADLAGHFVTKFVGSRAAEKASRILIFDRLRGSSDIQPAVSLFSEAKSRAVKRALLLMESNLEELIDLTEIANEVALSRRQLERLFAAELGVSPKSAYLALRLQYAKSLLESSDLAISEVAFRCGFVSPGNFSRAFRAGLGKSPSQLRVTAP